MLRSKSIKRILGVLVGVALIIIVWLAVIRPLTSNSNKSLNDDTIATDDSTNESPLDNATVDSDPTDEPPLTNETTEDDNSTEDEDPSELAQAGPMGVSVAAIVALATAAYLFTLNKRLKQDIALTYTDR